MSKQFLQKPRYEYYKGTTEVIDNELDNFVEDVVDRLNEQYFNKRDLLKVKQNQDEQIADLQHKLEVVEKALELLKYQPNYYRFVNENTETIDVDLAISKAKEMMENE